MKYSAAIYLTLLASWVACIDSFLVGVQPVKQNGPDGPSSSQLYEDASSEATPPPEGPPPDLIDKEAFLKAIFSLQGQDTEAITSEDLKMYAIGKTQVNLDISTSSPGLSMSESTLNGVVIVTDVAGPADEAGIQPGDTITGINVEEGIARTKGLNLQEVIGVVQMAAQQAIAKDEKEIQIELNRLIPLMLAPE